MPTQRELLTGFLENLERTALVDTQLASRQDEKHVQSYTVSRTRDGGYRVTNDALARVLSRTYYSSHPVRFNTAEATARYLLENDKRMLLTYEDLGELYLLGPQYDARDNATEFNRRFAAKATLRAHLRRRLEGTRAKATFFKAFRSGSNRTVGAGRPPRAAP